MKKIILFIVCLTTLVSLVFCQTNTFPVSGNVGIGTISPSGLVDVHGAYYIGGYKFMDNVITNPSVGFFNPVAFALRRGKMLYPDEVKCCIQMRNLLLTR